MKVFVYGSLRAGMHNHRVLEQLEAVKADGSYWAACAAEEWDAELGSVGGLRAHRTLRQALRLHVALDLRLDGMRNTENNPSQERVVSAEEPAVPVSTRGNQIVEVQESGDKGRGGRGPVVRPVDTPALSVATVPGHVRVVGGHNPNHPGDYTRNLRDLTDGNAGPFVVGIEKERGAGMAARHGDRPVGSPDDPAPSITAGSGGSGPRLQGLPGRLPVPGADEAEPLSAGGKQRAASARRGRRARSSCGRSGRLGRHLA